MITYAYYMRMFLCKTKDYEKYTSSPYIVLRNDGDPQLIRSVMDCKPRVLLVLYIDIDSHQTAMGAFTK